MEHGEFLGLALPVVAALVVLLLVLALVARQLHQLGVPRVVRAGLHPATSCAVADAGCASGHEGA